MSSVHSCPTTYLESPCLSPMTLTSLDIPTPGRNCVSIQLLRPRQHAGPSCLHTRAVLTGRCMRMLVEPPDLRGPKGQAHTTSSPQLNYLLQGCRQDQAWLRSQLCLRLPFPMVLGKIQIPVGYWTEAPAPGWPPAKPHSLPQGFLQMAAALMKLSKVSAERGSW